MKKLFVVLCTVVFVSLSAQAIGIKSTMDSMMEGWVGEDINAVIDVWGYPDDVRDVAGRKLYYWTVNKFYITGSQNYTYGTKEKCDKIFETDNNGTIIKWQWKGNRCPFTYLEVKKYVNPRVQQRNVIRV